MPLSEIEDRALIARARAATHLLQKGSVIVDGVEFPAPPGIELLAAVVWPENELLRTLGDLLEDE